MEEFEIMTSIKKVIDYSSLNYFDVLDLPCDVFQLMLKNSIIDELNKTDEGRKYLADCKRLQTQQPDIENLSKQFQIKQG